MKVRELLERLVPQGEEAEERGPEFDYGQNSLNWPVSWRSLRAIAEGLAKLVDGDETVDSLSGLEAHWAVLFWTLVHDAAENQAIAVVAEVNSELERLIIGDENGESAAKVQAERLLALLRGEFISKANLENALDEQRQAFEQRLEQIVALLPKATRDKLAKASKGKPAAAAKHGKGPTISTLSRFASGKGSRR